MEKPKVTEATHRAYNPGESEGTWPLPQHISSNTYIIFPRTSGQQSKVAYTSFLFTFKGPSLNTRHGHYFQPQTLNTHRVGCPYRENSTSLTLPATGSRPAANQRLHPYRRLTQCYLVSASRSHSNAQMTRGDGSLAR